MNTISPMQDPGIAGGVRGDVAVLNAKMKRDVPTLQLMASRGNINAALALKDIVAGNEYARGLQSASAMQTPEIASVLSQLGQKAENFQQGYEFPGAPRYAGGGRAFAGGGDADAFLDAQRLADRYGPSRQLAFSRTLSPEAQQRLEAALVERRNADLAEPSVWSQLGEALQGRNPTAYPEPVRVRDAQTAASEGLAGVDTAQTPTRNSGRGSASAGATKDVSTAAPVVGLAAAVTADDRQPRPSLQGATASGTGIAQAPGNTPDAQLEAFLKLREELRTKGDALTEKQRALLQQTHDATLKRLSKNSESKMGQLVEWADGILAAQRANPRLKRPLTLAGLGAAEARKTADTRQTAIDKAKAEFGQQNLLLDAAKLKEQAGDLESAYTYRQKAAELARKQAHDAAQADLWKATAERYSGEEARARAQARLADRRAAGVGAGPKPATDAQIAAMVDRYVANGKKADPLADEKQLRAEAVQKIKEAQAAYRGTAAPAPAGVISYQDMFKQ